MIGYTAAVVDVGSDVGAAGVADIKQGILRDTAAGERLDIVAAHIGKICLRGLI